MRIATTLDHPLFADRARYEAHNRELALAHYAEIVVKIRERESELARYRSKKKLEALGSLCRGVFSHYQRYPQDRDEEIYGLAYRVASAVQDALGTWFKRIEEARSARKTRSIEQSKRKQFKSSARQRVASRRYYQKNREKHREAMRKWREKNREKHRQANRKSYQKNREKRRAISRKSYQEKREAHREAMRRYYDRNRERINAKARETRRAGKKALAGNEQSASPQINVP